MLSVVILYIMEERKEIYGHNYVFINNTVYKEGKKRNLARYGVYE